MKYSFRFLLLSLVAVLSVACGDIVGTEGKQIDVYAVADGQAVPGPVGRVSFGGTLTLIGDDGRQVGIPLSSPQLRIEQRDSVRVAQQQVPAAEYTRARLTFARVDAYAEGGFRIQGSPYFGPVRVAIPAGDSVAVEFPVQITVPARAREVVVIDLRALQWMATAEVLTGNVAPAQFRTTVELRHW